MSLRNVFLLYKSVTASAGSTQRQVLYRLPSSSKSGRISQIAIEVKPSGIPVKITILDRQQKIVSFEHDISASFSSPVVFDVDVPLRSKAVLMCDLKNNDTTNDATLVIAINGEYEV